MSIMLITIIFIYFNKQYGRLTIAAGTIVVLCLYISIKIILLKLKHKKLIGSNFSNIDMMQGEEFEQFILAHFKNLGYFGHCTKASHDYGCDVLVKGQGRTIAIQCKRYKGKVGIAAVQQIIGSLKVYGANEGIVASNNYFTKNAKELASKNHITLWDRNYIEQLIKQNKDFIYSNLLIDENTCPRCKGTLIKKQGKFGSFIGCANYPNCTYTRN